jgi:hypothetical protein
VVNGGQTVNLVDPLPHGAPPQPGAGHTVHSSTPTPPPSKALPPSLGALLNGEPHFPRKTLRAPTLKVSEGDENSRHEKSIISIISESKIETDGAKMLCNYHLGLNLGCLHPVACVKSR